MLARSACILQIPPTTEFVSLVMIQYPKFSPNKQMYLPSYGYVIQNTESLYYQLLLRIISDCQYFHSQAWIPTHDWTGRPGYLRQVMDDGGFLVAGITQGCSYYLKTYCDSKTDYEIVAEAVDLYFTDYQPQHQAQTPVYAECQMLPFDKMAVGPQESADHPICALIEYQGDTDDKSQTLPDEQTATEDEAFIPFENKGQVEENEESDIWKLIGNDKTLSQEDGEYQGICNWDTSYPVSMVHDEAEACFLDKDGIQIDWIQEMLDIHDALGSEYGLDLCMPMGE